MSRHHIIKHAAAVLAAFLLASCSYYGRVKDIAYDKAASIGNSYCETRDPSLQTDLKTRVNGGLRDAGARFEFDGIACD